MLIFPLPRRCGDSAALWSSFSITTSASHCYVPALHGDSHDNPRPSNLSTSSIEVHSDNVNCANIIPDHNIHWDSEQPETAPRQHHMAITILLPDKNQLMPPNPPVFINVLKTTPVSSPPCCRQWGAVPVSTLAPHPQHPFTATERPARCQKAHQELYVQRHRMTSMNSDRACLLAGEHSGEQWSFWYCL